MAQDNDRVAECPVPCRYRRRGHFPDDEAALKVLYLAVRERRPNRANPTGQINGWKNILNVLTMTYGDRLRFN